jgi:hypothetical protein
MRILARTLFPLFIVALSAIAVSACGGSGPAPGEFDVAVRNDTGDRVLVQHCELWTDERSCASVFDDDPYTQELSSASEVHVQVHGDTSKAKHNAVPGQIRLLQAKDSKVIGCISYRIATEYVDDTTKFDVSQAKACSDDKAQEPAVVGTTPADAKADGSSSS